MFLTCRLSDTHNSMLGGYVRDHLRDWAVRVRGAQVDDASSTDIAWPISTLDGTGFLLHHLLRNSLDAEERALHVDFCEFVEFIDGSVRD